MRFRLESTASFCRLLLAPVLMFSGVVSAEAQCSVQQIYKLLADDGAAGDGFGRSVAFSGTTAVVGAQWDDDNGEDSGSAYLFDTTTGQQIAKLLPDDGAAGDWFGRVVAISGTIAIVGAFRDDDNGENSGSAYLFDITTGQQIAKLLPDDGAAGDNFGDAVSISGTAAIVGADDAASAYLFDATTGQQITKLLPDDGPIGSFGSSVAIDGNIAIIGASGDDVNGDSSGSAYLFDTSTGLQIAKLLPDDGGSYRDFFGRRVAISGTIAIVGCFQDDDNGSQSGSAYLFDTKTGQQIAKLLPDESTAGLRFGKGVAISGTIAIIGTADDSAYLFDTTTGQQITKVLPDGGGGGEFGFSVAINGTIAIVGAYRDDDNGVDSGSAYLFDVSCPDVVVPDSFLVTRGTHVSGGVAELADSDNADLTIQRAGADIQSRTEFEVKAVSPVANPTTMAVTLEGSVFARSQVNQTIELFDYVTSMWEQVDTREATRFTDSMVTVSVTGDLSRFVEAGTMCMKARIRYQSTNPRQRFASNTDQFIWTIGQ